jgi:hypothetical protein
MEANQVNSIGNIIADTMKELAQAGKPVYGSTAADVVLKKLIKEGYTINPEPHVTYVEIMCSCGNVFCTVDEPCPKCGQTYVVTTTVEATS